MVVMQWLVTIMWPYFTLAEFTLNISSTRIPLWVVKLSSRLSIAFFLDSALLWVSPFYYWAAPNRNQRLDCGCDFCIAGSTPASIYYTCHYFIAGL